MTRAKVKAKVKRALKEIAEKAKVKRGPDRQALAKVKERKERAKAKRARDKRPRPLRPALKQ